MSMELRYCRACETEVDAVDGECTKCGQQTDRSKQMKWNHRVVDLSAENGGEPLFGFREVYYGDDGKHHSFCDTFMESDDLDGLRQLVERLQAALSEPVIKVEEMK